MGVAPGRREESHRHGAACSMRLCVMEGTRLGRRASERTPSPLSPLEPWDRTREGEYLGSPQAHPRTAPPTL